jgi:hypothetical protein
VCCLWHRSLSGQEPLPNHHFMQQKARSGSALQLWPCSAQMRVHVSTALLHLSMLLQEPFVETPQSCQMAGRIAYSSSSPSCMQCLGPC